ncbi:helix-turn-helix domain-containing protein [Microbacterium sp.]
MTTASRELAKRLRAEGQSLTQIGRALGVSKSSVHRAVSA